MANGDVALDEFVFSGLDMTIMGLHIFGFFGGKTVLPIYGYQTYQNVCTAAEK